jgi:uncharacterized membrane protein
VQYAAAPPPLPAARPPKHKASPSADQPKVSLENRIGSQVFSRIGVLALLIATALFLKWAIDNHWIGPSGRVLAGLFLGGAVILWSERFRRRGFSAFSYSLKAIGSGALYLSLWAAFQLYHLLPAVAALTAMVLVTAWNAFMGWSQSSELLAAYALAGALATPLLLSTGGNHEIFLFTYLLLLDLAAVVLVRLKPWPRLLLGVFPATVAYFIAWYLSWYNYGGHPPIVTTTLFIAFFLAAFLVPSLRAPLADETSYVPITEIFLPLANATFTGFAFYFTLEDARHHDLLPWAAVLLAGIYLALRRLPQSRLTSAIHLALAVTFLTIAIPLKATGRAITIAWLTEGVALLWIASFLASPRREPQSSLFADHVPAITLRRLALFVLVLGVLGILIQPLWLYPAVRTAFLNLRFATALFGIGMMALCTAIAVRAAVRERNASSPSWLTIAAASVLALNLTAVLSTVRELEALWSNSTASPDADLQRSLAISAFLMIYGAVLLAIGFWRRSAFLRWQALILLAFTIVKVFLYDLRNLSQGYRVFSFLGLGGLLMAISFVYQKDWLALRNPQPTAPPRSGSVPHGGYGEADSAAEKSEAQS